MKIAVVGATGLVGGKMLEVLAERDFPLTELILVASEKSVGKSIEFNGKPYSELEVTSKMQLSWLNEERHPTFGMPFTQ